MDANLIKDRQAVIQSEKSVMSFRVHDDFSIPNGWNWRPVGVVRPKTKWSYRADATSSKKQLNGKCGPSAPKPALL